MAKIRSTYVFIQIDKAFVPAGFLEMHGQGRESYATFEYGKKYLKRKNALAIDPVSLPLQEGRFETPVGSKMLFGAIRDASPDGWGRHVLNETALLNGKVLSEFDYLIYSSEDRVGALAFGPDVHGPQRQLLFDGSSRKSDETALDFEELLRFADQIDSVDQLNPENKKFFVRGVSPALGSGLGGAQPKAPVTYENRQWIAKFSKKFDAWPTCRVEHATMTLAGHCGISVPETRVIKVIDRDVFLVERFDRVKDIRRHFISARTLLGIQGESDTDGLDDRQRSYQEIAAQLRLHGDSKYLLDDLEELYRRMVFNVLCNNWDDHLRNHGFLHNGSGWRLSPAYDVIAQPEGGSIEKTLYLRVGDLGNIATLRNALSQSEAFGLENKKAIEIINDLALTVRNNWEAVFEKCRVPEKIFPELRRISFFEAINYDPDSVSGK